jgi:hypothetical protein
MGTHKIDAFWGMSIMAARSIEVSPSILRLWGETWGRDARCDCGLGFRSRRAETQFPHLRDDSEQALIDEEYQSAKQAKTQ